MSAESERAGRAAVAGAITEDMDYAESVGVFLEMVDEMALQAAHLIDEHEEFTVFAGDLCPLCEGTDGHRPNCRARLLRMVGMMLGEISELITKHEGGQSDAGDQ